MISGLGFEVDVKSVFDLLKHYKRTLFYFLAYILKLFESKAFELSFALEWNKPVYGLDIITELFMLVYLLTLYFELAKGTIGLSAIADYI